MAVAKKSAKGLLDQVNASMSALRSQKDQLTKLEKNIADFQGSKATKPNTIREQCSEASSAERDIQADREQQLKDTLGKIELLADKINVTQVLSESQEPKAQSDELINRVNMAGEKLSLNVNSLAKIKAKIQDKSLDQLDQDTLTFAEANTAVSAQLNSVRLLLCCCSSLVSHVSLV